MEHAILPSDCFREIFSYLREDNYFGWIHPVALTCKAFAEYVEANATELLNRHLQHEYGHDAFKSFLPNGKLHGKNLTCIGRMAYIPHLDETVEQSVIRQCTYHFGKPEAYVNTYEWIPKWSEKDFDEENYCYPDGQSAHNVLSMQNTFHASDKNLPNLVIHNYECGIDIWMSTRAMKPVSVHDVIFEILNLEVSGPNYTEMLGCLINYEKDFGRNP